MRLLLIGVSAAATIAVVGPVWAQVPPPPRPWPVAAYPAVRYPFPAVTPEAAYNDGLINRWELEQYEGPTPPALQGPNPSGGKGSQGDRGK